MTIHSLKILAILAMCSLISCNGPETKSNSKAITYRNNGTENLRTTEDSLIESVFFSYNNGLSWKNKSEGLPSGTRIGLGGITAGNGRLALLSKDNGLYFYDLEMDHWQHIPTSPQLMANNPGALQFYKGGIYAGSQLGGVFFSGNEGRTWITINTGLKNLSIRKLALIDNILYAATNGGLYSLEREASQWKLEYGSPGRQVNRITSMDGDIYIATNQGAFSSSLDGSSWKKVYSKGALHNISSDDKVLYAMIYNELFSSHDRGNTWTSMQKGLPAELYTFQVVKTGNVLLAAQWDGVYRKEESAGEWVYSGQGLPENLAISNLLQFDGILVAAGNERTLKPGMTTRR